MPWMLMRFTEILELRSLWFDSTKTVSNSKLIFMCKANRETQSQRQVNFRVSLIQQMFLNPLTYASMIAHPQWMLPHAFRTNISQCTFKSDGDLNLSSRWCVKSASAPMTTNTPCAAVRCICQADVFKHCNVEQWTRFETRHCCEDTSKAFFIWVFFFI